jgi:hypothetical protein
VLLDALPPTGVTGGDDPALTFATRSVFGAAAFGVEGFGAAWRRVFFTCRRTTGRGARVGCAATGALLVWTGAGLGVEALWTTGAGVERTGFGAGFHSGLGCGFGGGGGAGSGAGSGVGVVVGVGSGSSSCPAG